MTTDIDRDNVPPDWAYTFHGHRCPFMPLGYRMGLLALDKLGVGREADHTLHVICELGEGHPQTCLMDGIQIATGATFGKTLLEKTSWGKLAATFWHPGATAARYALKAAFLDEFGTLAEFIAGLFAGRHKSAGFFRNSRENIHPCKSYMSKEAP